MKPNSSLKLLLLAYVAFRLGGSVGAAPAKIPPIGDASRSKLDLWGEAAMRDTNGASYHFFERLLPPPRYVNADFKYYPIVLCAPNTKVKPRLISNGSGVNLRGGANSWNDVGTPVTFRVGPDAFLFGSILERLQHPKLEDGYLPIVQIDYEHPTPKHDNGLSAFQKIDRNAVSEVYRLEAFASADPQLVGHGVVFVKFSLSKGTSGVIRAQVDLPGAKYTNGIVIDEKGQMVISLSKDWEWDRGMAHAKLDAKNAVTLAIMTKPGGKLTSLTVNTPTYDEQHDLCVGTWKEILSSGMQVETPEPVVNNAWRNLIIQDLSLIAEDHMNYSAGNQYQKMYAAESSDAAIPLMQWGYEEDFRHLLPVILDLVDRRLTNHFAAHKLDDIPRFYWQTRDDAFVKTMRPRWQKELDWIMKNRGGDKGLLPKDNYCTDIEVPANSFCSNASAWAALRDMVAVLRELGDEVEANRVATAADEYKTNILAAVDKSIRKETQPPFVPMALNFDEGLHDPITETRIGSYWNLVCGYAIGSGIFSGTERETWIPKYQETHGGLCMGMIRSGADNHTFWTGRQRTNPLYGMRYNIDTLRRDDVERALVSFYGMLAQGMTRNTFVGAEGCSLGPLDPGGRFFYCPPNSTSNGQWLWTLRHLLVQDFDLDNDGRPETLRLAFATPRRWLEDGGVIKVDNAPTAFGRVSYKIQSHLNTGEILADVTMPSRNHPDKAFLRVRVPTGWRVTSATVNDKDLNPDEKGTIEISGLKGKQALHFKVERN